MEGAAGRRRLGGRAVPLLVATIEAWEPEFCAEFSNGLEPNDHEGWYRKSWMVYVPPPHADGINLVGVPFSDTLPNGGLLLSAANRSFDGADPTHMAGAQRLHEATRHLNDHASLQTDRAVRGGWIVGPAPTAVASPRFSIKD